MLMSILTGKDRMNDVADYLGKKARPP